MKLLKQTGPKKQEAPEKGSEKKFSTDEQLLMESGSRLKSFFTDEYMLQKIVQKQKIENEK